MRRTTIVATIGPASDGPVMIEKLIRAGLNVARLNYSHGTHDEHHRRLKDIRAVSARLGVSVGCLQDLSGPKIRTGELVEPDGVMLEDGARFVLTTDVMKGDASRVTSTYRFLPRDAREGERILLDDGLIELQVDSIRDNDVVTRVVHGGLLKPHKGINLPGTALSVAALTTKDRDDAEHGLEIGVDFMALSFVRRPEDVLELKEFLAERGRSDMRVIAKIEKPEALQNLSGILDATDGVMVARGDLGVELPAEEVPMFQKEIIYESYRRGRPVITATQMLDSMIHNPRPTRAEASDIANAILDGSDAVMLSGETASGAYPEESVKTMARIATYTESKQEHLSWDVPVSYSLLDRRSVSRAVAKAACQVADELEAKFVITFTESGATARLVSHFRPNQPILAFTPSERVYRQLSLPWGITPIMSRKYENIGPMLEDSTQLLFERKLVSKGDLAVMIFGTNLEKGLTNVMDVHRF